MKTQEKLWALFLPSVAVLKHGHWTTHRKRNGQSRPPAGRHCPLSEDQHIGCLSVVLQGHWPEVRAACGPGGLSEHHRRLSDHGAAGEFATATSRPVAARQRF